ncbi:MAG TPA: GNAT family N-acetyltransferase [Thermoplasmata archaeon]
MRLYRGQSPDSRALFHPLPFDRPRLTAVLLYAIATRRFLRRLVATRRLRAAVVLTARIASEPDPIGFGIVGFDRHGPMPRAIFGYLVEERSRGLGVGTRLHEEMIDAALAVGIKRGGGTVLVRNVPNIRLLTKLGFELVPTQVSDHGATGEANLASDGDLESISRRFHDARAGKAPPPSG